MPNFSGEKLIPGDKYIMSEENINEYSMQMNLTVLNLEKNDFGGYICISSNALGKAEGVVRLQGKVNHFHNTGIYELALREKLLLYIC